jgi:hypothetical protein
MAEKTAEEAKALVTAQRLVPPSLLAPYSKARLLTDIHLLKEALDSTNGTNVGELKDNAYRSGTAAIKTARKYAPVQTDVHKLMGTYYRLLGDHGNAFKWWEKAVLIGERLGARVDLSRTYVEVGKALLESKNGKSLRGVDAKGYFDKA